MATTLNREPDGAMQLTTAAWNVLFMDMESTTDSSTTTIGIMIVARLTDTCTCEPSTTGFA